ncbi:MAG: hypothetical protein R3D71_04095 [Rickettsiales bacterium]
MAAPVSSSGNLDSILDSSRLNEKINEQAQLMIERISNHLDTHGVKYSGDRELPNSSPPANEQSTQHIKQQQEQENDKPTR